VLPLSFVFLLQLVELLHEQFVVEGSHYEFVVEPGHLHTEGGNSIV
jgi:hypothetical protein